MTISVAQAARTLEPRGVLVRRAKDHPDRIIAYAREQLGPDLPDDLVAFYREAIERVGDFRAICPTWNQWVGYRSGDIELTALTHVHAVPLFWDGCGNVFGLDLTPREGTPAVYFFEKDNGFARPEWAAGSCLGSFLLLLADHDRAGAENWPPGWELRIDPDIDRCPRARAIWNAE
jgi:hypothetical protein